MSERALHDLLAAFPGKGVLVLGDIMLDEYIWGEARRISPEAPVPVVEVKRRTFSPGGAANSAANVAALGGRPILVSVIGRDNLGVLLREELGKNGIGAEGLCVDGARATTVKSRIVAHQQQVVRLDSEDRSALAGPLEEELLRAIEKQMAHVHACIISDYAKGVVTPRVAGELIRLARRAGKPVVVDPKGKDYSKYRGATLVKPNIHEAEVSSKQEIAGEAGLHEAARRLLEVLEDSAVLITRGAEGMSLFRNRTAPVHVPVIRRNVFDVTGAGDTVASTLAMSLATGAPLEQAMQLANWAASIVVGKVGTATVTPEELLKEMH
jgi:D-beta-D-heptose 7-phosphate kinase/D-beta-D-heptose 1-phosphate adenosyltransferase